MRYRGADRFGIQSEKAIHDLKSIVSMKKDRVYVSRSSTIRGEMSRRNGRFEVELSVVTGSRSRHVPSSAHFFGRGQ